MEPLDNENIRGRFFERFNSEESAAPSWDSFKSQLNTPKRRPLGWWFTGLGLVLLIGLAGYWNFKKASTKQELAAAQELGEETPNATLRTKENPKEIKGESEFQKSNTSTSKKQVSRPKSETGTELVNAEVAPSNQEVKTLNGQEGAKSERTKKVTEVTKNSHGSKKAPIEKKPLIANSIAKIKESKDGNKKAELDAIERSLPDNNIAISSDENLESNNKSKRKVEARTTTKDWAITERSGLRKTVVKRNRSQEIGLGDVASASIRKGIRPLKTENKPFSAKKDLDGAQSKTNASALGNTDKIIADNPKDLAVDSVAKPITLLAKKELDDTVKISKANSEPKLLEPPTISRWSLWAQAGYLGQNLRIANTYNDRLIQVVQADRLSISRISVAAGTGYQFFRATHWKLSALIGLRFSQAHFTAIRETLPGGQANLITTDSSVSYEPMKLHSKPKTITQTSVGLLGGISTERKIKGPWSLLLEGSVLTQIQRSSEGSVQFNNQTFSSWRPAVQYSKLNWEWSLGLDWIVPFNGPKTGEVTMGNNGVSLRAVRYFKK